MRTILVITKVFMWPNMKYKQTYESSLWNLEKIVKTLIIYGHMDTSLFWIRKIKVNCFIHFSKTILFHTQIFSGKFFHNEHHHYTNSVNINSYFFDPNTIVCTFCGPFKQDLSYKLQGKGNCRIFSSAFHLLVITLD